MFMFTLQTDRFLPSRETTSPLFSDYVLIIVSFFLEDPIRVVALRSSSLSSPYCPRWGMGPRAVAMHLHCLLFYLLDCSSYKRAMWSEMLNSNKQGESKPAAFAA